MKRSNRCALRGAASLAAVASVFAGAWAADDSQQMETVVVTGIRASIENTIALKKQSMQIVEAVSAEDIGKLPDQSIAEAIARLPGMTAQRVDGRAQNISIRGLAPDFSISLLNGREQVSTGDNRSAEYDQYPSELMSGVVIYKTPTADLIGGGLSGTVDMRTIRPLDWDHRALSVNVRGEMGSLDKLNPDMPTRGYRGSATYVDQLAGGKLGLVVGVAHMVSPQQIEQFNSWGYPNVDSTTLASGGAKLMATSDLLTRSSAMTTLQYRPSEAFESTLDLFYTKFKDKTYKRGMELPLYSWGSQAFQPGYKVEDGLVVAGTYSPGASAVIRNELDTRNDDLMAIGWKNKYVAGDWTTTLDVSYSSVQRRDKFLETYGGTGRLAAFALFGMIGDGRLAQNDPMSFTTNSDGVQIFSPTLDYSSFDKVFVTDSQSWGYGTCTSYAPPTSCNGVPGGQDGYYNNRATHDYLFTAKLSEDVSLNAGMLKAAQFGVGYSNRHKAMMPTEGFIAGTANVASYLKSGTFTSLVVPQQYQRGVAKISEFGFTSGVVAWDAQGLLDSGLLAIYPNNVAGVTIKGWQVDEMVYTGYVRGDLDGALGPVPFAGNVGVQVVYTHQSSSGFAANTANFQVGPIHDGTDYVNVLPSLNLSFNLTEDHRIRLGVARELVRARMDQMSASTSYAFAPAFRDSTDINHSPWSGNGGNPKLRPWLADAVDVSYEYYFSNDAYLSVAGFYKNLESYIIASGQAIADFTNAPYTGPAPALFQGIVSAPVNGTGGRLDGVEMSFAAPGSMLWDALDGFGVTLNASYTDSNIKPNPKNPMTPLPGLSKAVLNATLYYERGGFSIRLNQSYRSKFLGEVTGFGAGRVNRNILAQGWLDGQIGYEFLDGALQGLALQFQVNNITGETMTTYQNNDVRQVIDWQSYGTQYLVGLSYKL